MRVKDPGEPPTEQRRLVMLQWADLHTYSGDLADEKKDFEAAVCEYEEAEACVPSASGRKRP
jgi:hypothetical protein